MRLPSILFVLFGGLVLSACQQGMTTTTPSVQAAPAAALSELPVTISPFTTARAAAQRGHLTVSLVGDSITEGANIDPAHTWATKFTAELTAAVPGSEVCD